MPKQTSKVTKLAAVDFAEKDEDQIYFPYELPSWDLPGRSQPHINNRKTKV